MTKKFAEPEMTSAHSVKVLLCYLLERLGFKVTKEQLLEITEESGVIDYFLFAEAMADLENVGAVICGEDGYVTLGEKGRLGSERFNRDIPATFRRRILSAAYAYFARIRRENACLAGIRELPNGYSVDFSIKDANFSLMDISFYAPDREQAEHILGKIRHNPSEFYKNVVELMLSNPEEEIGEIDL